MALLFKVHQLTEQQAKTALEFSPETRMMLENLESSIVEEKLRLSVLPLDANGKPVDIVNFVQGEAYLRGKMDVLKELLYPIAVPTDA